MSLLFPDRQWVSENNATLWWQPGFLPSQTAEQYFALLLEELEWQQGHIQLYSQTRPEPRLSAFYGETGITYNYSGRSMRAQPWPKPLYALAQKIAQCCDAPFNAFFCNLYRGGQDAMGWHSDDEPSLGVNPVIASLSLGETRQFLLRHKQKPALQHDFMLGNGDLLIMAGETQLFWQHSIVKTQRKLNPRINLTFRYISSSQ